MSLLHSLSKNSLLLRARTDARYIALRHTGWLISILILTSLAFSFPSQAQTLTTLVKFNRGNGARSNGVVLDSSGNLYGTTGFGGGTIWEIAKGSSTITTLAHFHQYHMQIICSNRVTAISNGNLYGTTDNPSYGQGAVWELDKGSNHISILASFSRYVGKISSGVTLDSNGNLYGTTSQGGIKGWGLFFCFGYGTVWEIVKGSHTITTLAYFRGSNGACPSGVVSLDSNGNLYGNTESGTKGLGSGTVWKIIKGSRTITLLAKFSGVDFSHDNNGCGPIGGVTLDSTGNLYGTTAYGGARDLGAGTVWELVKGSSSITTLARFNGENGAYPRASVIINSTGNLYGTAANGGAKDSNDGTVWELVKGSNSIITLATFNGENGAYPRTSVILNSNGNLYGTTDGGPNNFGTLFEVSGIPGTSHPPGLTMYSERLILGVGIVLILGLGGHFIRDLRVRERLRND